MRALTDSQVWRMAQIVALDVDRGMTDAAIEKSLLQYVSGAQPDDIAQALEWGKEGRQVGQWLSQYDNPTLRFAAMELLQEANTPLRGYGRVRIGPGENDWRGFRLDLPAGSSEKDVAAEAKRQVAELRARAKYEQFKATWSDPEIVFLVPT